LNNTSDAFAFEIDSRIFVDEGVIANFNAFINLAVLFDNDMPADPGLGMDMVCINPAGRVPNPLEQGKKEIVDTPLQQPDHAMSPAISASLCILMNFSGYFSM